MIVTNYKNELAEFSNNEIIVPNYGPSCDLEADKYLYYLMKYIHGITALKLRVSEDVRQQLNFVSFDKFIQRWLKSTQKKEQSVYEDIVF